MAETRCRRRKHIRTIEIPQEVICYNILPRLPAKSLIRCLSVSKQWHSFLKSPIFANMHLNRVINDDHQKHYKLLVIDKHMQRDFSMDCETLKTGHRRPLPFKFSSKQDIQIKSSCNGLVLILVGLKKSILHDMISDLILWNPLTGDYKNLSKSVSNLDSFYHSPFELYYNSSEEDYRLIHITNHNDVQIYSLKSDSWRKIHSKDAFQCIPNFTQLGWSASTCWNENLYFMKRGSKYYSIVRFDTKAEKFTEIATSFHLNNECSRLTVQRGCIHMFVEEEKWRMKRNHQLWSMNINGVWNMVSTYTREKYIDSLLDPLHLMKDGNWLMKAKRSCSTIYKLDLEDKHIKHIESVGSHILYGCVQEMYIETFVSPNQYMN